MKKINSFLALLLLLVLLTACGSDDDMEAYNTAVAQANIPVTTGAPGSPGTAGNITATPSPVPTVVFNNWENISPLEVSVDPNNPNTNQGFQSIAVDPKDGSVYVGTCYQGLWKSTDQGKTWAKINTGTNGKSLDTGRLWTLAIDPVNPQIIYTTAGYGDGGILKSTNGGKDWTNMIPASSNVMTTVKNGDISSITIDPFNHDHLLAAYHSAQGDGQYYWNAPVLESLDAGANWTIHPLSNQGYNHEIFFMDNSTTWLLATWRAGLWRTTDSGQNWTQVSTINMADGGGSLYRSKAGMWYAASANGVLRSTDGLRWARVGPTSGVFAVTGDGTTLYTLRGHSRDNTSEAYSVSSETNGTRWSLMSAQKFDIGPASMAYDSTNHILYSSNWLGGVWRLGVSAP